MKERLTGAVILVSLVVVVVPELLSGPIRPASRAHGPASSAEAAPLRSYTISFADEPHGASGSLQMLPASAPSPPAPAAEPAGAPRAAESAGTRTQEPAGTARAPEPAPPARTMLRGAIARPAHTMPAAAPTSPSSSPVSSAGGAGTGAYVVQLGSFASRANAQRLAAQVHGQGFQVSVSRATTGRRLYRVRVGPAPDHAAAEQLAAQLKAKGHGGGAVVPK